MSEITLRKIVDDVNALYKPPHTLILLQAGTATGNGAAAVSIITIGVIPYRSWRVINVGFTIEDDGASTIAETISFGAHIDGIGFDADLFGTFAQDVGVNKNVSSGDFYQRVDYTYISTPDAPLQAGTPVWSSGNPNGFLNWYNKQALITIQKNQVLNSTATVKGWVLIEIGEV